MTAGAAPRPVGGPLRPDPLGAVARAAAGGDLRATRRLLDALAPRVMRVVRAVLGAGHPDVDDVAQESLIALVKALPAFRGEASAASYASRIAARTAVAARKRWRTNESRTAGSVEDYGSTLPDTRQLPPEQASAERRKAVLRQLLDQLSPEQAETLTLRIVLGFKLDEVAAATGAPLNTVRSRIRLAKEALRRKIAEDPALAEALEVGA